jgi:Neuraminidase (sialidase)
LSARRRGDELPNAEVEPFVAVNPTNADNIVGVYQQDRYSNGGAKGTTAAMSFDGGATWANVSVPTLTRCQGGEFDRASDPWVTFSPDGVVHSMSLVTNAVAGVGASGTNGMVYSRSSDGGHTWDAPILLIRDSNPRYLNDKNSITADPNDPNYVYAA